MNFRLPLEMCQVELFNQCQISPTLNFRHPLEECQFPRSVSYLFPLEMCQVELFRQCQVSLAVNFRHPLEDCQFPRLVSCHHHHHCLVVLPLEALGRKTSLASPRKKLGTLTLNSSRH